MKYVSQNLYKGGPMMALWIGNLNNLNIKLNSSLKYLVISE